MFGFYGSVEFACSGFKVGPYEDEDDFEALITFPDGEFARATSTSDWA